MVDTEVALIDPTAGAYINFEFTIPYHDKLLTSHLLQEGISDMFEEGDGVQMQDVHISDCSISHGRRIFVKGWIQTIGRNMKRLEERFRTAVKKKSLSRRIVELADVSDLRVRIGQLKLSFSTTENPEINPIELPEYRRRTPTKESHENTPEDNRTDTETRDDSAEDAKESPDPQSSEEKTKEEQEPTATEQKVEVIEVDPTEYLVEIDRLKQELELEREKLQEMTGELEQHKKVSLSMKQDLKHNKSTIHDLNEELSEKETALQHLTNTYNTLNDEYNRLKSTTANMSLQATRIERLESLVESYKEEIDALQKGNSSEMHEYKQMIQNSKEKLNTLLAKYNALDTKHKELMQENNDIKNQRLLLKEEISNQSYEIDNLSKQNELLKNINENCEDKIIPDFKKTIEQLQQVSDHKTHAIRALNESFMSVANELDVMKESNEQLMGREEKYSLKIVELGQEVIAKNLQISTLQESVEDSLKSKNVLLASTGHEISRLTKEINRLSKVINTLLRIDSCKQITQKLVDASYRT